MTPPGIEIDDPDAELVAAPAAAADPIAALDADGSVASADDDGDVEPAVQTLRFELKRDLKKRLDVYLQARLKGISRAKVQKLIELGHVTLNGRTPKSSTLLRLADQLEIRLPPIATKCIAPEPIPLDVLYEDDDLIVINKQAGIIVHPARSHTSGTLVNALAYRFEQQQRAKGLEARPRQTRGFRPHDRGDVIGLSSVGAAEFRPGIIHRLDKNTTGVLVIAKRDETHWAIARQFEYRTTLKAYLAVVHGNFEEPGGAIEQPIGRHPTIHEACCVRQDHLSKHALTLYRVREQYRGYSLVELELKTGRTHQIRVHLSWLGYPIAGDLLYGGEAIGDAELSNPPIAAGSRRFLNYARNKDEGLRAEAAAHARPDLLIAHPALHATLLSFEHPATKERPVFTAPLHEPMRTLVRRLREQRLPGAPVATEGTWVDLEQAVGNI